MVSLVDIYVYTSLDGGNFNELDNFSHEAWSLVFFYSPCEAQRKEEGGEKVINDLNKVLM